MNINIIDKKQTLLDALLKFVKQRPRLELVNYASYSDYRRELRSIGNDLTLAKHLIYIVRNKSGISDTDLNECFNNRLTYNENLSEFDYTTGQYFPVEYRPAAIRGLLDSLFKYYASMDYSIEKTKQFLNKEYKISKNWLY
jgi:hypothetical protein